MSSRPLPPPPPGTFLRVACLVVLALPLLALAHTGGDGAAHHADARHGLVAGLVHPLTGLDHLLAMLAVGMWSALALRRRREVLLAPVAFAATVLAGALAARAGLALPGVEPMIAASLLALGLMVATRAPLGAAGGAGVAALFALFHGGAHGQELAGADALAGMVLATALLHAAGLGLGAWLRARPLWATRGLGAGVALAGLAMFAA